MGAYLSQPITDKESSDGEDGRFKYGTTAMQGWRTNMEDAHATILGLDDDTAFFGVYDGHGGKEVAIYISRYLHEVFKESEAYKRGDVSQGLVDAFLAMDTNMIDVSARDELTALAGKGDDDAGDVAGKMRQAIIARVIPGSIPWDGPQAGSTCVVAVIRDNTLTVANAGDSRAVLCRRGEAIPLSRDHKPQDEDERARIQNAGGFVQEGRVNGSLALSRAIGDLEYKQSKNLPAHEQIVTAHPEITVNEIKDGKRYT